MALIADMRPTVAGGDNDGIAGDVCLKAAAAASSAIANTRAAARTGSRDNAAGDGDGAAAGFPAAANARAVSAAGGRCIAA